MKTIIRLLGKHTLSPHQYQTYLYMQIVNQCVLPGLRLRPRNTRRARECNRIISL